MANARAQSLATREVVVLVASVLMLLASFMSVSSDISYTPWHQALLPLLVMGYLTGIAVGVLVAIEAFGRRAPAISVGLSPRQLLGVLSTVSFAMLLLTLLSGGGAGPGLFLATLAALVLFVVTVLGDRIPALSGR